MITKLDWLITRRMASRIMLVVLVFFFLIFLSESLDTIRFNSIARRSGDMTAWLVVATSASRWAIKSLSVTVLIGAVVGMLEFQASREFVIMKAAGLSIWRIMRGPMTFVILLGFLVTGALESVVTSYNRDMNPTPQGLGGGLARSTELIWLEQDGADGRYFIQAGTTENRGQKLLDVEIFPFSELEIRRIRAQSATYEEGVWQLLEVRNTFRDGTQTFSERAQIATNSLQQDLRLIVGSTEDFTYFELWDVLQAGISDPLVRSAALTRFLKLTSLPFLLVGSLLIAFAFTAGYRRNNAYGMMIVYGIILGFVVFVITEMASRAGSSGILDPAFATWGPAIVSVLIGTSVLLRKEDGIA